MRNKLKHGWRILPAAAGFNLGVLAVAFTGTRVPWWSIAIGAVLLIVAVIGYVAKR